MPEPIAQNIQMILYVGFGLTTFLFAAVAYPYAFGHFFHRYGGPTMLMSACVVFGLTLFKQVEVNLSEGTVRYSEVEDERDALKAQNIRLAAALKSAKNETKLAYRQTKEISSRFSSLGNAAARVDKNSKSTDSKHIEKTKKEIKNIGEKSYITVYELRNKLDNMKDLSNFDDDFLAGGDQRLVKVQKNIGGKSSTAAYEFRNTLDNIKEISTFDVGFLNGDDQRLASAFLNKNVFEESGQLIGVISDIALRFGDMTYDYVIIDYDKKYKMKEETPIPLPWLAFEMKEGEQRIVTRISPTSIPVTPDN